MDLKVRIYSAMPGFVKAALTRLYMRLRVDRERRFAEALPEPDFEQAMATPPQLVYITGFPRNGTTLVKYYLGSHPGLQQTKFDPVGFFKAWEQVQEADEILIEKSNHYISTVGSIFRACGKQVRLVCAIRDPRDCLVSFLKYEENREVPRNDTFWDYWSRMHEEFLAAVREGGYAECVYLLRYEDLVRYPVEAKADFLNWLGVGVAADELDAHYTIAHEGEGWHDSVQDHCEVKGFALEKWKQSDPEDGRLQQRLALWEGKPACRSLMALFGYGETLGEHQLNHEPFKVFKVPPS